MRHDQEIIESADKYQQPNRHPEGRAIFQIGLFQPFIVLAQFFLIWLIPRLLGWFFVAKKSVEVNPDDIEAGVSYVLAPNHQSFLDPFILSSQIPLRTWLRLAPIRSFAYNGFFDRWYLLPWLILAGCFPAKHHDKLPYGLTMASDFLASGQTIAIFPEGTRSVPGTAYARHGVAVLAKLPDVRVIPMHIQWTLGPIWKRRCFIAIGKPQDYSDLTAQFILDRIYALKLPE